ncbi:MAG: hypothetical protein ABI718_07720 [Acidobacteriota bacterium]
MPRTLVLDFDGSVGPLPGAETFPLRDREEEIRFSCRRAALESLPQFGDADVTFLGSGDFHHVSYTLLARRQSPMQVVVFDNHPDNMRYPFGIHCGSWVWHAARLPHVARIHVVGINSGDVEGAHALENHLGALRSGKVVYWCLGRNLRALRLLGVRASQSFSSAADLLDALGRELSRHPVYLSIDKDVLADDIVRTNWDQGVIRFEDLEAAIAMLRGTIVAADIVGDVSAYRYRSPFKRLLSALDGQPEIEARSLASWQEGHRQVNLRLLELFAPHFD